MKKNEEISYISLMKTILMLMIYLYHSCLFFSGNWFTSISPIYNSTLISRFSKFYGLAPLALCGLTTISRVFVFLW
jgi:hypothetical protein